MPPKAVRGRCKKLAGKYINQKRKAEETEDLEVHADNIQYQIREKRGRKSKKDVSPCTSNTQERSSENSISPPRSAERSPHRPERSPQRPEMSPQPAEMSPQQSKDSTHNSPSPPPSTRHPESSDAEDESASSTLPEGTSKRKQGKCKGNKGKDKTNNENPPPGAPYSFTQVQEEEIAGWLESKKLLYDIKDKHYKDKALRRQLCCSSCSLSCIKRSNDAVFFFLLVSSSKYAILQKLNCKNYVKGYGCYTSLCSVKLHRTD